MKETFYKKVGRKYVPIREYDSTFMDSYPYGTHLVIVKKNGMSRIHHVDENHVSAYAAFADAEQEITKAILKALEIRPSKNPLTERQIAAWKELSESFGDERFPLQWPSVCEAVSAGREALCKKMNEKMTDPVVKKAYEQFLMVYNLSK